MDVNAWFGVFKKEIKRIKIGLKIIFMGKGKSCLW